MTAPTPAEILEVLRTASEALDNYSDIVDGDSEYGTVPMPNAAMSALEEVDGLIERLEAK